MATSLFVTEASSGIGAAFLEQAPAEVNEPHTFSRRPSAGNWTQADPGHPRQRPAAYTEGMLRVTSSDPSTRPSSIARAPTTPPGKVGDLDSYEYATVAPLNATVGPALSQALLRSSHQRGIRATLVLTSSPAADKNVHGMAHSCAAKHGMQRWGTIVALEQPPESGNRVVTVDTYTVLTDVTRSVITRTPDEVPLVTHLRQVEAAGDFARPNTRTQQIWSVIYDAADGDIVAVGAVTIAQRAAATAGV
ncbi:hypothetical protein [Lapillicoccus sp.]|uniref:hypothetical protein n=1 Tax=Lapillicoccus sp. TaxID=1909287 RepID=UPI0039833552